MYEGLFLICPITMKSNKQIDCLTLVFEHLRDYMKLYHIFICESLAIEYEIFESSN